MTTTLVLITRNSFLRLAIEAILRGSHDVAHVETVAELSAVTGQRACDLILFDTALLDASPHATFLGIAPPILAINTGGAPLGLIASARFQSILSVGDDGRLDVGALRKNLPLAIKAGLSSDPRRPAAIEGRPILRPLTSAAPRDLLLIGASTGGPDALIAFLGALGPPALPVVVAIHMPADQTAVFADHLSASTGLSVSECAQGALPCAGQVAVLKGGTNYRIECGTSGIVLRRSLAEVGPYRPCIDMLFGSAADAGLCCDVVVLSGMGEDGAAGAARLEAAGGRILVQRPDSCVVAGMPTATLKACVAAQALTPAAMAAKLMRPLIATRSEAP